MVNNELTEDEKNFLIHKYNNTNAYKNLLITCMTEKTISDINKILKLKHSRYYLDRNPYDLGLVQRGLIKIIRRGTFYYQTTDKGMELLNMMNGTNEV